MNYRSVNVEDVHTDIPHRVHISLWNQWIGHLALALAVAVVVGLYSWRFWLHYPGDHSDIAQVHAAARAVVAGRDAYAEVGPGRPFAWQFPLLYPLTAAVALLPFAPLPEAWATTVWAALTSGVLVFALSRRPTPLVALAGLASVPAIMAFRTGQWSPLFTAALVLPPVAALVAAKPTVGLAILAAGTRRHWAWAASGGAVLLVLAFVLQPSWVAEWRAAIQQAPHVRVPLARPGGALVLLALLRWRRPEARLLVALAAAPQSPFLYEALPLILVPRTLVEQIMLSLCGFAASGGRYLVLAQPRTYVEAADQAWLALFVGCYLPALVMVLRRPNAPPDPA